MLKRIQLTPDASRCSNCGLGEFCLPVGLAPEDASAMDELVQARLRIGKGQPLFTLHERLDAIYGIRSGTFKTLLELADGRQQITGFHLPGEIVGLDGVGQPAHVSTAVALEDSEVCIIPVSDLSTLASKLPSLQLQVMRLMSREIAEEQRLLVTIGAMRAEERLAAFLINLSERMAARGYSSTEFVLRMSREEIGSFLGLKLETVSRLFSRFARAGLLNIQQKQVRILDMPGLKGVLGLSC